MKQRSAPQRAAIARRHKRWGVAARALAAIPGGYVLTTLWVVALGEALPGDPAGAVVTAGLLSFVVLSLVAMWAFAAKTVGRAWLGMVLAAALAGLVWVVA